MGNIADSENEEGSIEIEYSPTVNDNDVYFGCVYGLGIAFFIGLLVWILVGFPI